MDLTQIDEAGNFPEKTDGALCSGGVCDRIWASYAGEIPDFTQTSVEQVEEWIDVVEFCCLSYASEQVLTAVKNATEEQIRDENWIKQYWDLERGVNVGNMSFWYKAWTFLNKSGMTWKKFKDPNEDSDAYIFCDNKTLTLVWRGTESAKDWMTNLQISFVEWPHNKDVKGSVHLGMLEAFDSLRSQIRLECEKLFAERSLTEFHISGHSMGAGLTALSCLDFTLNPLKGAPPIYAINVSSPIVGTKEFSEYFVTVFPNLVSISHAVDPVVTASLDAFQPCGNRVFLKVPASFQIIKSHFPSSYLKYAVETQKYINDNQIQQQAATAPQERFVFT